jgi:hypothetical protein
MKYPIGALLTLLCNLASAYTDCQNTEITRIYKDVTGNFFIATGGYLNGYIDPSDKAAIAMVVTAYTSGRRMLIRYSRDGITCGAAAWNEIISGVGL